MIKLVPRQEASRVFVYLSPVVAVVLTVLTGAVLFAILGFDPLDPLFNFFIKPLLGPSGLTNLLGKATPLILIATGLAMGYRANVWNIGAEGQFTIGAVAASGVALLFWEVDSIFVLPLMFIAGAAGGAAWAAIPAFLRTRFNASELLVSLMLVLVATQILLYLVHGPWKDPDGFAFPESRLFSDSATLPRLFGTRINLGFPIAVLAVAGAWLVMGRTLLGFQIKVSGAAPQAARFAGFSESSVIWLTLLVGGGLAGVAGLIEVSGTIGQLVPVISPGFGFTAIIVAFLGRLNPVGILFAGLLMALSFLGGETVQIENGLPRSIGGLFQGVLLFYLLAADVLIMHRIVLPKRAARAPAGAPAHEPAE